MNKRGFEQKPIGGYFELELNDGLEYHPNAARLNTGRNAFEFILRGRGYRKVYLPFYTCEIMLRTVTKLGIEHGFYHIDKNFEPLFDFAKIRENEGFVYTNYYGLKDRFIEDLTISCRNLIIDNAQAFFSRPVPCIDIFYSPRKFFGLPDGAYLYTDIPLDESLEQDHSDRRFEHLLARTEYGPEHGYPLFIKNNQSLDGLPIQRMSKLTWRLLKSIDYPQASKTRRINFLTLQEGLGFLNKLDLELVDGQVPMVYPFYATEPGLRQELIEKQIYVAQYWPNVPHWTSQNDLERDYFDHLIPLPVDQRYSAADMERIVEEIRGLL